MPETDPVSPERLRESLVACMDFAEDALLLRADQALSSASQNRYFEVLGDLRHQRRRLIDEFFICWEGLADTRWPGGDDASEDDQNHARHALALLDEIPYAAEEALPLPVQSRFREALAEALSLQALRAEGQLSLLKAIEAQCPALSTEAETADLGAWLRALAAPPENLPADPPGCARALAAAARNAGATDPAIEAQVEAFLAAWQSWMASPAFPDAACAVLGRLRLPLAGAFLINPDWFRDEGCAQQLLADFDAVLPGLDVAGDLSPPMVHRTLATLAGHPERLPGVWLEWRVERERRAELVQEWLESVEFDARHAAEVRLAQGHVRALYAERLLDRSWPAEVLHLLREGWSEVLLMAFLHPHDTHRMGRREAIRLLDDLLDSVRPDENKDKAGRQSLMSDLAGLMRQWRTGLEQTGMNSARLNDLLHGLRAAHGPLVFGRGDAKRLSWQVADAAWLRETFPQADTPAPGASGQIAAGDWIEFVQEPVSGLKRYRVVHVFPDQDRVALFNELYVVFHAPGLTELSTLVQHGDALCLRPQATLLGEFDRVARA